MTKARKFIFVAGLSLLALCLLSLAGALVVLRSDWFKAQVRQRIVREVEAATGGRAEVGEFVFDWHQLRAEVSRFVLHGKEQPGEPPLFSAASVQVGLKIVSFLRRDVDLDSLTVVQPRVNLVLYKDGGTNLPEPEVVRRHRQPIEEVLALAIRRFRVEDGFLSIDARRIPLDVRGENLAARLSYEAAGPRYRGDISFRRLNLSSPAIVPVAMDADLSLDLEANRVALRAARLVSGRSSVQASGTIDDWLSPRIHVDFDARLALSELRTVVKLPVAVQGPMSLTGKLSFVSPSQFSVVARASGGGLSLDANGVRVAGIRLATAIEMRPDRIDLSGLSVAALGGTFSGGGDVEKLRRFHLRGDLANISIVELAQLRKVQAGPWNGRVSGPVEVEGELAGGEPRNVKATVKLGVEASDQQRPVTGLVAASFNQRTGALEFEDSYLSTPASRLQFSGALAQRLRVDLESKDLNDLFPLAASFDPSIPAKLPIALRGGAAKFTGGVTGGLSAARVSGRLLVSSFQYESRVFDRLDADFVASASGLEVNRIVLDQDGTRLQGQGRLALAHWKPVESSAIAGSFAVRGLPVDRLLAEAGSKLPVQGSLSATVQLAGSLGAPAGTARLNWAQGVAFGQKIDAGRAQLRYSDKTLAVESVEVDSGAARVQGSATFVPGSADWKSGHLKFESTGKGIRLAQAGHLANLPEGLDGDLDVQVRGEASISAGKSVLTELSGKASLSKVTVGKNPAGQLQLTATTHNNALALDGTGEIAGARIAMQVRCRLQGNYPVEGQLEFTQVSFSSLRPWLASGFGPATQVEGQLEGGRISFAGSALARETLSGRLELAKVEILPPPGPQTQGLGLRNEGPVVLVVTPKEARIQSARFVGKDTSLEASGRVYFGSRASAYDLRIRGDINLAVLHNFDPNLTASGESTLDATIRGPRTRPEVYGRLDLQKASFYLSGVPNGVVNASGLIFLFRDRATIENVTAETGGGKLTLNGFVTFGSTPPSYRLQATAEHVRVRYPQGISTSLDASLSLTGTTSRSLLSGGVTILRSGISPDVDLAGLLSRASQPMITPANQNELLRGMQFDVRVETSPNARFQTALTRDIQAETDLRLRGTAYKPVLLGRISVNQGEINFLGNRYTITRGEISLLNPVRLEPVLDFDLETRIRGIDVTLNFSGPLDRLNLTYRSDPPLQINEIIALLAVGRAPTSDPAMLARQSEQSQSWQQIGASTLLGQALAAPVAGRLERLFGVSRIKIDPQVVGWGNSPEAQLTLEQQVSRDITFTYVTSLAQEQQQLIRVEWNATPQWSILAVREENGLFGIEFQYKKQFK